jgi:DNA-binding YbaB/EbfC family protein
MKESWMRGLGNLGGMGNMGNIMKQAQKAMEQMQKVQEELAQTRIEGSAGGGMVRVEANGQGQIETVTIDPQVVDPEDVEMLQDLVVSAVRDAIQKAEQIKEERMKQVTGGMGLPGMF